MTKPGLLEVVRALRAALDDAGEPYMLIGGLAVIARGVPRVTRDVDTTIWAENLDLDTLLATLGRHGFVGRIPDVAAFARRHFVLLLDHEQSGTPVDLTLAWVPFEREALGRAEEMDLGGARIRVEQLATRHRASLNVDRILGYIAEFAEALEESGRVEDVRRLIRGPGRPN